MTIGRLQVSIFTYLNDVWGQFTIDRFADDENAKITRFNTKFASPGTEAIDAFSQCWQGENNFLVPPVKHIPQVIQKITRGSCSGTLVVPLWQSAPYWPRLQLREYEFASFIKKHLVFDNVDQSALAPGNSGFGPLGPNWAPTVSVHT